MALSFPYPTTGTVIRPTGQGCSVCVHREYCTAFYWYYRDEQYPSEDNKAGKRIDNHLGLACNSWSQNEADRVTTISADDLAENERLGVTEKILVEPFRNGLTDQVTADAHEPGV
jgi:hypothetical protein